MHEENDAEAEKIRMALRRILSLKMNNKQIASLVSSLMSTLAETDPNFPVTFFSILGSMYIRVAEDNGIKAGPSEKISLEPIRREDF